MIYCLSNHHTGTWSTLYWLTQHQGVDGMNTGAHVFDMLEGRNQSLTHLGGKIKPRWHPNMVYHEHSQMDGGEGRRVKRTQVMIATMTPTVIPLRDPLATMIRYQAQAERDGRIDEPGRPRFDPKNKHVNLWIRLAETSMAIFKNFAHIRFLPWDLIGKMNQAEKFKQLVGISRDLGLDDEQPSLVCSQQMIRENDYGDYPLKAAYLAGDTDFIRANVSNGGYNALVENVGSLRPFLESHGYRDLLWWS